jgi:integrase
VSRAPPQERRPQLPLHKQSGQAIVTVNLDGTREDFLLGRYDSPESKAEYRRLLADLEAGKVWADAPRDLTVNELSLRYWDHAEVYYRDPDGNPTSELTDLRYAIRAFRESFGDTPAREFGPRALKRVRDRMIAKGWARPTVNKHCGRVKRVIRWAVENELLPADRWEALRAVRGLAKGRCEAPEPEPVGPVAVEHVRAVLPLVTPPVRALIEVHLLTGMRPGEACRMRPCDIDMTGDVWVYRPARHKTRWRGKVRDVAIGAKAQEVLKEFTPGDPTGYYFDPRRAVEVLLAERSAGRKTPRWPSHLARNAAKRAETAERPAGVHYTPHSYAVAVARARERAGIPHWHPNQIRHTFATLVRERFGLKAAQVLLRHKKADVTQLYAERNRSLARRWRRRSGDGVADDSTAPRRE